MSGADPFRAAPGGVLLDVRLTPRGGRDGVDGLVHLSDGRAVLACRVRAVPEDGRANAALEQLVARWLGLPRSAVTVASGHTARLKTLRIDAEPALLEARVASLGEG